MTASPKPRDTMPHIGLDWPAEHGDSLAVYDAAMLESFARDDWIAPLLESSPPEDAALTCHRWLKDSPAKRMIFADLYGDLLRGDRRLRVLDIGGGLTGLTRLLAARHDYHLVDIMAHDSAAQVEALLGALPQKIWAGKDWHAYTPEPPYDLILANDLFPNVDQRLELFIDKYLPLTRAMRLSLTIYPAPRFYPVRRTDADEIMCLLAWDHRVLRAALTGRVAPGSVPDRFGPSLYPNGRQILRLSLQGGAA